MVAIITVPASTDAQGEAVAVGIVDRSHGTEEIAVGMLATHKVALVIEIGAQLIFIQTLSCLHLLIIAFSTGVVQCPTRLPTVRKTMTHNQLVVLLMIVVRLIIVENRIAIGILIFATRIISSAIFLHISL